MTNEDIISAGVLFWFCEIKIVVLLLLVHVFWYLHFDNDEWPEASVITILSIQMQFMPHDIYRYLYRNQILSKNLVSVSSMCLYSRSLIDILKPDWHVIIWLAVCQELWINAAVCLAL